MTRVMGRNSGPWSSNSAGPEAAQDPKITDDHRKSLLTLMREAQGAYPDLFDAQDPIVLLDHYSRRKNHPHSTHKLIDHVKTALEHIAEKANPTSVQSTVRVASGRPQEDRVPAPPA